MSLIEIKKKILMAQKGEIDISDVFNTSLWTGNGAARTITTGIDSGEGSLVWSKARGAANGHILVDTVRGAGNYLSTNSTGASVLNAQSVSSFTSTGYDLGTFSDVNGSGTTQVGWQFRLAEKFFDIVQYTGDGVAVRQIAHNLGVKPGMMILKRIDAAGNWTAFHVALGDTGGAPNYLNLNLTDALFNGISVVSPSEPDDSYFFVGPGINASGGAYLAYLFAHDPTPEGLIQCGSYVGNGSATGPVVNLGWKPQYLMVKNSTAVGDWQIIDAQRGFAATNDAVLRANASGAETSANLANPSVTGFQIASAISNVNTNGQTYIYMAIREAI